MLSSADKLKYRIFAMLSDADRYLMPSHPGHLCRLLPLCFPDGNSCARDWHQRLEINMFWCGRLMYELAKVLIDLELNRS